MARSAFLLATALLCLGFARTGIAASDDSLVQACDLVMQLMKRVPADRVTAEHPDKGGQCRLVVDGRWARMTPRLHPDWLLGAQEESPLARAGWWRIAAEESESNNGVRYSVVRQGVRCDVVGTWDGGDANDPTYVPDDHFTYVVTCIRSPIGSGFPNTPAPR